MVFFKQNNFLRKIRSAQLSVCLDVKIEPRLRYFHQIREEENKTSLVEGYHRNTISQGLSKQISSTETNTGVSGWDWD